MSTVSDNARQSLLITSPDFSEEPVEPQSFRNVLMRAFCWVAFVPLMMLAFLQQQQLQRQIDSTNHQQLISAQMMAETIELGLIQTAKLLTLAQEALISNNSGDRRSIMIELRALAPEITNIQAQKQAYFDLKATSGSTIFSDARRRVVLESIRRNPDNGQWQMFIRAQTIASKLDVVATVDVNRLIKGFDSLLTDPTLSVAIVNAQQEHIFSRAVPEDQDLVRLEVFENEYEQMKDEPRGVVWRTPGQRNLAQMRAICPVKFTDWTVMVIQPLRTRDAQLLQSWETSGFLFVVAMIMTLLIGYYTARPMTRKVTQLMNQVEQFGRDGTVPVPTTIEENQEGPSEIVQLQKSFRNMAIRVSESTRRLENFNTYLESEVQNRTNSLKHLYAELDFEHQRLVAVFESMTEGVVLVGKSGLVNYANQQAKNFLGDDDWEQHPIKEIILKHYQPTSLRDDPNLFMKQVSAVRMVNIDDSEKIVDVITFYVHNLPGQAERVGLLLRDVTQMAQLSKLKDSLIGIVAHELKTPIATIRLQAETLTRGVVLSETEKKSILTEMVEESYRLSNLINDWLDISRFQEGRFDLHLKIVQIAPLIEKAQRLTKQRYDVAFTTEIAPEAECLRADPDRLTQVFINLFVNAGRYKKEGDRQTRCEVRVSKVDSQIVIEVKDYGIGIESEQSKKIFDRFYQIDMSSRRRIGGSGLGLAICRALCEAHGGTIHAESQPGEWSKFIVCLPY